MYTNILEAKYINRESNIIEVLHETKESGVLVDIIEVGSLQYNALLEAGWNEEKIVATTAEWKRAQAKIMHDNAVAYLGKAYYEKEANFEKQLAFKEAELALKEAELEQKYSKIVKDMQTQYEKTREYYGIGLLDNLFLNNENNELLFQIKLEVLEKEEIKAADKQFKSKIRKAKKVSDVIRLICEIL